MPLVTEAGGLLAVLISADGSTWKKIVGRPITADGLGSEAIKQEHTTGSYQSGQSIKPKVTFSDYTNYAAVEALCLGATRDARFIAFQYPTHYRKSNSAHFLMINEVPKSKRSEGDNLWQIEVEGDDTIALTRVSGTLASTDLT